MTPETLKHFLYYNHISGDFYWRNPTAVCVKPWEKAGGLNNDGYVFIRLNKRKYRAHHLAWLYVNGFMPNQIDHKNGVRTDNSIANLRLATQSQNNMNKGAQTNNKAGLKGVFWVKKAGKYCATVTANGKRRYLGYFADPQDAHAAYVLAAAEAHGSFAHFATQTAGTQS
jgi:hypothetical protein